MKSIPLFGKYGKGKSVMVSDCDYEFLKNRRMSVIKNGYVMFWDRERSNVHYLHRWIMGCDNGDGHTVDHMDGDKLNCTRENLNVTTRSKNMSNRGKLVNPVKPPSSKYVGVRNQGNKWIAIIKKDCIQFKLGTFDSEEEAALAYNRKAVEIHQTYATLNIVNGRVL
jgi:hypothetical protein